MIANVACPPTMNLASIAVAAGQQDADKRHYRAGRLYVENVSQETLDAALLAYDPAIEAAAARARVILDDLAATDDGMARVVEDLVALLVDKNVVAEAELPPAARDRLITRRTLRAGLAE